MSQLSASTPRAFEVNTFENSLPVLEAITIYRGSAVGLSAGYARQLVAGDIFKGFAEETVDNTDGSSGDLRVHVRHEGIVQLAVTSVAITDEGKPVFASDGNTFSLVQGTGSRIGRVHRFVSTGIAMVQIESGFDVSRNYSVIALPITLAGVTAADVLTAYTPGFAGRIESLNFAVTTAVTTAAKAASLNAEIGTTNVTGGVVALTSANCTPLGAVVAGTAVTAANEFTASDTISIEASSVTAFSEGAGVLYITISTAK